jgi:predicted GNAT family acetyltransferase
MQLGEHADASAFLAAAAPVLDADEARHNLIHGICSTLIDVPDTFPDAHFWTVRAGDVVAAAMMTPPFNLIVAQPRDDAALPFLADALHARSCGIPGVTGAIPEADVFAEAWERLEGVQRRLRMSQGIYVARAVKRPAGVSGEPRRASAEDRDLVIAWARAFEAEALAEDAPHVDLERGIDRRLQSATSGFGLWVDGGEPVSLCGYGGRTPHGVRIGPVYTPPELRGRGYGSAVTAHVTHEQLTSGRDYCFLYTDLQNPTSNKIYVDIGYERVCDSADYVFEDT